MPTNPNCSGRSKAAKVKVTSATTPSLVMLDAVAHFVALFRLDLADSTGLQQVPWFVTQYVYLGFTRDSSCWQSAVRSGTSKKHEGTGPGNSTSLAARPMDSQLPFCSFFTHPGERHFLRKNPISASRSMTNEHSIPLPLKAGQAIRLLPTFASIS